MDVDWQDWDSVQVILRRDTRGEDWAGGLDTLERTGVGWKRRERRGRRIISEYSGDYSKISSFLVQ